MNAFEQLVAGLFEQEGYWTRLNYKVDITKEQKVKIGKPSMPRPEIDVLAYRAKENTLLWLECKSYMDSFGVRYESFIDASNPGFERYKVFNYPEYREVITSQLIIQTVENGLVQPNPTVKHGLVTGNIYSEKERNRLKEHFEGQGWLLFDESWVKERLRRLAKIGYEDNLAVIVAKLFGKG